MTSLFIGVVSHENSRFAVSQGPSGLAALLVDPLSGHGLTTDIVVNTSNDYDPAALVIDGATVKRSLDATLRLEATWQTYLRAGSDRGPARTTRDAALFGLRWASQTARYVRPWQSADNDQTPGSRLVRRLVNIELSHLSLLREGIAQDPDWLLILEDDAATVDVDDCAAGLAGLMTYQGASPPQYVNVSQSFTPGQLGIAHLLSTVEDATWRGSAARSLVSSSRPVTNTVCAILYRTSFARTLVDAMDALPMDPVVPIDWKLNMALMQLFHAGALAAGDCWLVDPGPIDQLSMRAGPGQ